MPEMNFDFANHFENYKDKKFFDQYSYTDLKKLSEHFVFLFSKNSEKFIGLQFHSSYKLMAAMIAAMHTNKIGVLISTLETKASIDILKSQVDISTIFTDRDADLNTVEEKNISLRTPDFNDQSLVVFSSGSTKAPKGIALTFGNIFYSAKGFEEFFKQTDEDVSLMNLPHHHVGGLMTLWRTFFTGGKLSTNPSEKFDFVSVVPLQLSRDIKNVEKRQLLKSCRVILVGGAKFTEELKNETTALQLKVYETYGMSETTSLVCINGNVLPYRNVHLSSDGFFLVKGKTLTPGIYINQTFQPLILEKDGFYKTNDVGFLSASGTFQFSHRADLIFVSGGENINPLPIEETARQYPGIKEAYVVSLPDEKWEEMGVLIYEADAGFRVDTNEVKTFLKSKLHPHHVPKKFYEMTLSQAGQLKPKRSELKKRAEELYLKEIFSFSYIENNTSSELLVILHGFTGEKSDFNFLCDEFRQTHSILTIDLPGHGQTKAGDFFSTTDVLKKLSSFIKLFGEAPLLYGYSMGGRVALQLALNYLKPKKLILESAGPGLESIEECSVRQIKDVSQFDVFHSSEEFLVSWYQNKLFKKYSEGDSFQSDIKNKSTHDLSEWKNSQLILSQGLFPLQSVTLKALSEKSFPVYFLYGSEDTKYKNYGPLYPESFEILGASHNPHKTHPSEITQILKTILK
jgi:O-succinylbenzoic acid--CoA ligase